MSRRGHRARGPAARSCVTLVEVRRLALLGVLAAAGCGRIDFDTRGLFDSGPRADGDGATTTTIQLVQKSTFS
jgi:hypothetical protein